MIAPVVPARLLVSLVGLLLLAAGCGSDRPTYPKAQLTESLQALMMQSGLDASVHVVNHTLGVHLSYPGALEQTDTQIRIGPEFDEAIRKTLTPMHRVLLSTDAEIDFYVLLISDPQAPNAYLTIVRHMEDIRRANVNIIDTTEMFARTVYDFNSMPAQPISIEQYVSRDIQIEEFLSWQLAKRIQHALTNDLQISEAAEVGRCTGRFQDGEFVFTLDVSPVAEGPLDEPTIQQMFQASTGVVAKVLSSYAFESFNTVRLIHPLTGRHLVLPKARLEIFR